VIQTHKKPITYPIDWFLRGSPKVFSKYPPYSPPYRGRSHPPVAASARPQPHLNQF